MTLDLDPTPDRCSVARSWSRALGLALALALPLACTRSSPEPAPEATATATAPAEPTCLDRIHIDVVYPGASAHEVEDTVVLPIEAALDGVASIEHVDSIARERHAEISLEVSGNLAKAAGEVRSALGDLSFLPPEVEVPWITRRPHAGVHVVLTVRGPDETRSRAADELERVLLAATGIRGLERRGRVTRRVIVDASPERLAAMGVTIGELTVGVQRGLSSLNPPFNFEGLGALLVAQRGGHAVRVADVAEIRLDAAALTSQAWIHGEPGEVWRVDADDVAAIRSAVTGATLPPGVVVEVAGQLRERTCPGGALRPDLVGDLELFELRLADVSDAGAVAERLRGAPTIGDLSWWTGHSLLDDEDDDGRTGHAEILLPAGTKATELRTWLEQTPGVQWLAERGAQQTQLVVELEHPDLEALHAASEWLGHAARGRGLRVDPGPSLAQHVEVHLDREAMARLAIGHFEVQSQLRAALDGTRLGTIRDGDDLLEVRLGELVGSRDPTAAHLTRLDLVRLHSLTGAEVPLSAVARIELTSQPSQITRHDGRHVHRVEMSVLLTQLDTALELIDRTLLPDLARSHPDVQARRKP